MNEQIRMRETRLTQNTAKMTVDEVLAWAARHIPAGWLLAESPEGIVWEPFTDTGMIKNAPTCMSLVIFGPNAEIRLQKPYGAEQGEARALMVDDNGQVTFERRSSYLLGDKQRLQYAEHFCPNEESGVLQLAFARFCGVSGGGK